MSRQNVVVASRIPIELAEKMRECARRESYVSPSEFIRDAIREKVKKLKEA